MGQEKIGEIIAKRELQCSGATEPVTVLIGKPQKFSDGDDFFCPYQITGGGFNKVNHAAGIDTVQALALALRMIGADLNFSSAGKAGQLSWIGGEGSNLGFPIPDIG